MLLYIFDTKCVYRMHDRRNDRGYNNTFDLAKRDTRMLEQIEHSNPIFIRSCCSIRA